MGIQRYQTNPFHCCSVYCLQSAIQSVPNNGDVRKIHFRLEHSDAIYIADITTPNNVCHFLCQRLEPLQDL